MKIKVCGMREPNNLKELGELGVNMIGFIFYPKSPRYVSDPATETFIQNHPSLFEKITKVGVFVNAELEVIFNKVHDFQLDVVQLHGDESPEYCRELQSYWKISTIRSAKLAKAFPIDESFNFEETAAYAPYCSFFVFDTRGDHYGGHGKQFDWSLLENYKGKTPFLLSGGLSPAAIDAIKKFNHPYCLGVDLNSGFELEPGLKNIKAIEDFKTALL